MKRCIAFFLGLLIVFSSQPVYAIVNEWENVSKYSTQRGYIEEEPKASDLITAGQVAKILCKEIRNYDPKFIPIVEGAEGVSIELRYLKELGFFKEEIQDKSSVNREEVINLLFEYYYRTLDSLPKANPETACFFNDFPSFGYLQAFDWACQENLIFGTGNDFFSPLEKMKTRDFLRIFYRGREIFQERELKRPFYISRLNIYEVKISGFPDQDKDIFLCYMGEDDDLLIISRNFTGQMKPASVEDGTEKITFYTKDGREFPLSFKENKVNVKGMEYQGKNNEKLGKKLRAQVEKEIKKSKPSSKLTREGAAYVMKERMEGMTDEHSIKSLPLISAETTYPLYDKYDNISAYLTVLYNGYLIIDANKEDPKTIMMMQGDSREELIKLFTQNGKIYYDKSDVISKDPFIREEDKKDF